MTVLSEDALGMKLHAFDVVVAVANAHDRAVLGVGRGNQTLGEPGRLHHEGVVSRHFHR